MSPAEIATIVTNWSPMYGDSRTEVVVIGCNWDKEEVKAGLQAALVTDEEFEGGQGLWDEWDDPLPKWDVPSRPETEEGTEDKEDGEGFVTALDAESFEAVALDETK